MAVIIGNNLIANVGGSGSGLEVGDIGIAGLGIDESKGLRRYLNGSVLDFNENTQAFVNKVQSAAKLYPGLICSEEEWESIAGKSVGGQCGKFGIVKKAIKGYAFRSPTAIDDYLYSDTLEIGECNVYDYDLKYYGKGEIFQSDSGLNMRFFIGGNVSLTAKGRNESADKNIYIDGGYRLPKINTFIQGLTDLSKLGELVEAGLPNITGTWVQKGNKTLSETTASGALKVLNSKTTINSSTASGDLGAGIELDASLSNPIYGNSDTVQPEAICYPYFIQIATGATEEVDIKNEIELNNPWSFGMRMYSPTPLNNLSFLKSEGQWNSGKIYKGMYEWIIEQANNGVQNFKTNKSYAYNGSINCWFPVEKPIVGAWAYSTTDGNPIGVVQQVNSDGSLVVNGQTVRLTGGGSAGESLFTDYDFRVNTENQTFMLPLLDGSEDLPSDEGIKKYNLAGTTSNNADDIILTSNGYISAKVRLRATGDKACRLDVGNRRTSLTNSSPAALDNQICTASVFGRRGDTISVGYGQLSTTSDALHEYYFIPAKGNGSLYYYVGAVTQNEGLIDAGRLAESLPDKADKKNVANIDLSNLSTTGGKVLDGEWVKKQTTIAQDTDLKSVSNANPDVFSLSNYLPNDGYSYEVYLSISARSSGHMDIRLGSQYIDSGASTIIDATSRGANALIVPVGSNREIRLSQADSVVVTIGLFRCLAYRRIGTNK